MSYFDLDPDVVSNAGRRTAATASTWLGWANRSEMALRNAAGDAQDSVVTNAIEGYLSSLNPAMKGVAKSVEALGANTESASYSMINSDSTANALLGGQGHLLDSHASALRRPINP